MPDIITMTFEQPINSSLQIGDTIYKSIFTDSVAGSPIELGTCTVLSSNSLTCNIPSTLARPSSTDFIMFSKDNKANMSSLVGNYMEVEMRNDSTSSVNLFQVGSVISESSK